MLDAMSSNPWTCAPESGENYRFELLGQWQSMLGK